MKGRAPWEPPSPVSYAFGQFLAAVRIDHGVTQDALAAASGMNQQSLSRIENGHFAPRFDTVLRYLIGVGRAVERRSPLDPGRGAYRKRPVPARTGEDA